MNSRPGKTYYKADCLYCNTFHDQSNTQAGTSRWARKHVVDNPGHVVHMITERTTIHGPVVPAEQEEA